MLNENIVFSTYPGWICGGLSRTTRLSGHFLIYTGEVQFLVCAGSGPQSPPCWASSSSETFRMHPARCQNQHSWLLWRSTSTERLGACAVWPGCAAAWWARACVPAVCWASAGCGAFWVRARGCSASSPPRQPPGNLRCAAAPGTGTDVEPQPVTSGRKQKHTPNQLLCDVLTLWQGGNPRKTELIKYHLVYGDIS